jgi:hypothetical protein
MNIQHYVSNIVENDQNLIANQIRAKYEGNTEQNASRENLTLCNTAHF